MRYLMMILLTLCLVAGAWADETGPSEPEDTEILVPDLILEVEELTVEDVQAVLPPEGELALGQLSIPLPTAGDLDVDDAAFAIPLPGVSGPSGGGGSFFSSGRLGAGTANHVLGEITLYKLGDSPRFRVEFSHEGIDGFQFRDAGTGFFSSSNAISGSVFADGESTSMQVDASFQEETLGLQGLTDYYSVGVRSTNAVASLQWVPDPLFTLDGTLSGTMSSRILSGGPAALAPNQEFSLLPAVTGTVTLGPVDLSVAADYFLRFTGAGEMPVHNDIEATAGILARLPHEIVLSADVGVFYEFGGTLAYPWSLSATALLGDGLALSATGGYSVERLLLDELWSGDPLLAAGSSAPTPDLANNPGWFGTVDARWSGPGGLTAQAGASFSARTGVVDMQPFVEANGFFPYYQIDAMQLVADARVGWQPTPNIQVEAGWSGAFLDTVAGQATSAVDGSVRFTDNASRFEGAIDVRSGFYPDPDMPLIGLSGVLNATEGVEFVLEFDDVLAPLLSTGRASVGSIQTADFPFIEPGFRASLYTRISL